MTTRKKILWLCSWYPNKTDPFEGDFIQRHAKAAAICNDIHVLRVVNDDNGIVTNDIKTEITNSPGLTEEIIYIKKNVSFFGKLTHLMRWLNIHKKAIKNYIAQQGNPEIVHVHVPVKAGLLALWMKRNYGIPYIVTEHLGIYNDKVEEGKYVGRPAWFKSASKKIFSKASSFLTVSRFLGDGVNNLVTPTKYTVIPNTVDIRLFFLKEKPTSKLRFIHVSNMVPLKNVDGILEAAKILQKEKVYFELVLVGPHPPAMQKMIETNGLQVNVSFRGEVPYNKVAEEMQKANALILFSDIENSPCVIGEALCCGLPVIATNVGGIPELVDNNNGLLTEPKNAKALAATMKEMMMNYKRYNRSKISAQATATFSYEVIGKMFDEVYESIVNS